MSKKVKNIDNNLFFSYNIPPSSFRCVQNKIIQQFINLLIKKSHFVDAPRVRKIKSVEVHLNLLHPSSSMFVFHMRAPIPQCTSNVNSRHLIFIINYLESTKKKGSPPIIRTDIVNPMLSQKKSLSTFINGSESIAADM